MTKTAPQKTYPPLHTLKRLKSAKVYSSSIFLSSTALGMHFQATFLPQNVIGLDAGLDVKI